MPDRQFPEIQVKSVLNRVEGMPFRWSINPYRGCSHGCVFCLSHETPILMADGTIKPLGEVSVGDAIYGTLRRGAYRRYVRTVVLARWTSWKTAYRVRLEDGTEIIAGGDHRLLSDRGWKFVTGAEQGVHRRPHLTTNNKLMGTGAFSNPPDETRDYKHGYLSVAPAITRKRTIEGQAVKSTARLRVAAIEPLGIALPLVDITTGTGDFIANGVISHNCYARRTHWFLDEDGVNEWDTKVFVKVNAPDVLRLELSRPSWKRETVALGTATDPYQAIEGRYRITRGILEALRDFRTPVSIITRCPMIVRDLDILQDVSRRAAVTVCVSVATTDNRLARQIEPTVAPPVQRLRTVERLTAAGIRTGVMLAPILPGLTDDPQHIEAVIRAARYHGAHFVGHNVLHLGDVTRDVFTEFLRDSYRHLVPLYKRLYPRQYAPRDYQQAIHRIVSEVKERLGVRQARYVEPSKVVEQLGLFRR